MSPGALFMKGRKYLSHVRRRKPFATWIARAIRPIHETRRKFCDRNRPCAHFCDVVTLHVGVSSMSIVECKCKITLYVCLYLLSPNHGVNFITLC